MGREYVEIVNTSAQAQNLTGWQIKNALGQSLHVFSSTTIPPGTPDARYYLTVYFGPVVSSMVDDDFFDGDLSAVAFSGQGNALANDQDCIYIENASGVIVDAIIYGIQEPSGSGCDAVRSGAFWIGIRENTSFAAGAIPIAEGGVLGRNVNSDDYDGADDWRVDGGANTFGHTIGRRNCSMVFDDGDGDLIWCAQALINNAIGIYGGYNGGYVQVTGATHSNVVLNDPGPEGGYSVTSDHSITIQDQELGQAEVLTGPITVTYERTTGSSFDLNVSGSLQGTKHSLDVDISERHAGFGTTSHGIASSFDFVWHKNSQLYAYSNVLSQTTTWTGQYTQETIDNRNWTDWSGIPKRSQQRVTRVIGGDGITDVEAEIIRSYPFKAPPFGQSQTLAE